jgi:BirA family biotin operon repressor/biotin-[acetyl-CoA-carboxylase] ligase
LLSQRSLERALLLAGIAARPRFVEEAGSTNRVALDLAESGAEEWTVVAADHQTAGRGRLGRSWASASGKSLLFSLILRPGLPPAQAPLLSLLASWAMAEACPPLPGGMVRAKWPNDLVVRDRKLGGILAEAKVKGGRVGHVALGVGVNVAMAEMDFPEGVRSRATSLAIEGRDVDAHELLTEFLVGFRRAYAPEDSLFWRTVLDRYIPICATVGRRVRATTLAGKTVEGTAATISQRGELVVEGERGRHVVAFGEVAHLD